MQALTNLPFAIIKAERPTGARYKHVCDGGIPIPNLAIGTQSPDEEAWEVHAWSSQTPISCDFSRWSECVPAPEAPQASMIVTIPVEDGIVRVYLDLRGS